MLRSKLPHLPLVTVLAALLAACGDDGSDSSGPEPTPVLAKAPTKSGDQQQGVAGEELASALRVIVTLDGAPAPGVEVQWSAGGDGSMAPPTSGTDAEGIAQSFWTLGLQGGPHSATASVSGAEGSPVTFSATAIQPEPPGGTTVQVLSAGGNRFEPANVDITVGQTVTWAWPAGSLGHNVSPDNGTVPERSGDLTNGPATYSYTFTTPGVYRYYCEAHGAAGGLGMSGTVTVLANAP